MGESILLTLSFVHLQNTNEDSENFNSVPRRSFGSESI